MRRQVVTQKGTAGCPQWHWGALTGGDGCISTGFSPGGLGAPPSSLRVVLACLWCCQDLEQPGWLPGSVFGSPGTSGVGEAVLGSQRVATNPGLGQLP